MKLQRNLGGLRRMTKLPEAVFILDTKKEHIGVTEANKLHIPIVAVVDTNCDPDVIQFVIPGNDDAIRSGTLMCRIIADAVDEGRFIAARRNPRARRRSAARATQPTTRASPPSRPRPASRPRLPRPTAKPVSSPLVSMRSPRRAADAAATAETRPPSRDGRARRRRRGPPPSSADAPAAEAPSRHRRRRPRRPREAPAHRPNH